MLRALYGNLVCSGVKRFTVGGIRQPGGLVGRYVYACQHPGFQFVDSHGVNRIGDSPNRVLLPQRTVGHVLAQTTDCDASAYLNNYFILRSNTYSESEDKSDLNEYPSLSNF